MRSLSLKADSSSLSLIDPQRSIHYKRVLRPDLLDKATAELVTERGRPARSNRSAAMKTHLVVIILLAAHAQPAGAQDHLVSDPSAFADPDSYLLKCRHVFAPAFEHGIRLRALVLGSFTKEYVVGLQFGDAGAQAFVLEPSSSIWDTELLEMYKTGEIGLATGPDGKEIPLEQDEAYKELKKRTPADYRAIKAVRRARPLPRNVADGIKTLWEVMLLEARHAKKSGDGLDGTTYRFSASVSGRGDLSGHTWSPDPESKTGQLARLAEALAEFAKGTGSLKTLTTRFEAARKSIGASAR